MSALAWKAGLPLAWWENKLILSSLLLFSKAVLSTRKAQALWVYSAGIQSSRTNYLISGKLHYFSVGLSVHLESSEIKPFLHVGGELEISDGLANWRAQGTLEAQK